MVTFNGQRFDVPFLRAKALLPAPPRAHVDLLYIARAAGLAGGQKAVEEKLGLVRDDDVRGIDGLRGRRFLVQHLYGNPQSYTRLLRYNRTDVEMMPRIAARLCGLLTAPQAEMPRPVVMPSPGRSVRCVRRPESFAALQTAWLERRPSLRLLETKLQTRFGRQPVVVGIDLRAKAKNPTGWAVCRGPQTETRVMFDDAEILDATLSVGPDLVSINTPSCHVAHVRVGRQPLSPVGRHRPRRKTHPLVPGHSVLSRLDPADARPYQARHRTDPDLEAKGISVIESYPAPPRTS